MALHKNDDGTFGISSHRTWLPGCYADERTARLAFRLSTSGLQRLQDESIKAAEGKAFVPISYETVRGALRAERATP